MVTALGFLLQGPFIWLLLILAAGAATFAFLDSRPTHPTKRPNRRQS